MSPLIARIFTVLSGLGSVIAVSSSFEGVIAFYGHLRATIDAYIAYIREPLSSFLSAFWPDFIIPFPAWAPDYIVILSLTLSALTFMEIATKTKHRTVSFLIKSFFVLPWGFALIVARRNKIIKEYVAKEEGNPFAHLGAVIGYRIFVFLLLACLAFLIAMAIIVFTLPIWLFLYLIGTILIFGDIKGRGAKMMFAYIGCVVLACFVVVAVNEQYRSYCDSNSDRKKLNLCEVE